MGAGDYCKKIFESNAMIEDEPDRNGPGLRRRRDPVRLVQSALIA